MAEKAPVKSVVVQLTLTTPHSEELDDKSSVEFITLARNVEDTLSKVITVDNTPGLQSVKVMSFGVKNKKTMVSFSVKLKPDTEDDKSTAGSLVNVIKLAVANNKLDEIGVDKMAIITATGNFYSVVQTDII